MATTLEAAQNYVRRGFAIVPVPHQSKNPGFKNWQQSRLSEDQLAERFDSEPMNIGLLVGEPSSWVVDVDLDHPRARELADDFLPETRAIFGRAGSPRSHRLYRVADPVTTKKHRSKSAGMIVELRSTGLQTIVPPSTHPSGEPIEWEPDSADPAEIDPEQLLEAVKRLADVVRIELGEKSAPKLKLHNSKAPSPRTSPDGDSSDMRSRCLETMLRMHINDENDGSARLYAAACRCVEHDLTDHEAIMVIRLFARERPFPTDWTDEQILQRLRDAETNCERGQAMQQDAGASHPNQASHLVALAGDNCAALFHDGDSAFATVPINGHMETWPLRRRGFKVWLGWLYYRETGAAPNAQAMQDALGILTAKALFDGCERRVHVRVAEHDGAIWIDLANDEWSAVRVDADHWEIVGSDAVPVAFVRHRAMQAFPTPSRRGSIERLRPFLNVRDESDWVLVLAWLIAALRPTGPYPILNITGEQGAAKTTLCRILRALVDPNMSPVRCEPSCKRDLMIGATHAWTLVLDNLSRVPVWLSDALCRLATGGGLSTRELYTDDDEIVFDAMRPVMLNGIEAVATRSDLLDRCVTLTLEPIPESERKTEAELWTAFDQAHPDVFGALLSAVSVAMRRANTIALPTVPRLADFALWATAAEPGLELPDGAFMRAYAGDRDTSHADIVEGSAVGRAILGLVEAKCIWRGTQTELLAVLSSDEYSAEHSRRSHEWPKGARKLAGDLRRLAPSLRALGVSVVIPKRREGRQKRKTITIEKAREERSARSTHAAIGIAGPHGVDDADQVAHAADHSGRLDSDLRSASIADSRSEEPPADHADHADRSSSAHSETADDELDLSERVATGSEDDRNEVEFEL